MVKHKAKSNLICIALVVIIIINTVLPSVSYGENFFSLYPTDEYFETNEPLEINEENSDYVQAIFNSLISLQPPYDVLDNNVLTTEAQDGVMYDDGMIIIMHQKLSILLENHSEEERKAIINNGKNLLYNLQILLKDLTMKDFNIKNLPDSSRTFLNTITSDARYYYIMLLHFDSYGANLYWDLLKLRAEQDEDFSWINEDYDDPSERMFDNNREQFLSDMVNSVDVVYNEYIQSYYNTNQSNTDQSGNEDNGNSNYVPDDNVNGDITSEDADNNENESHDQFADGVVDNAEESINNQPTGGFGLIANTLDGVLGLITYPIKLVFIILPGLLGQAIMSMFKTGYGTNHSQGWLTIDNILFNQLTLTDINIFSTNAYLIFGENANIVEDKLTDGNALLSMRQAIANWYYAFRNLAIVLSLLMLIYIGIRIALTNLAEKKAEYKQMLVNWFTGFGLIFILHYIIIIVILINNSVIQILARTNLTQVNHNDDYNNAMSQAYSYLTYSQDYEEVVDSNGNKTKRYEKDILIEITQDTRELVHNAFDNSEAKEKVDENKNLLYDISILLKDLENVGYDYTKLDGKSKDLFYNITNNLDSGQNNLKYDGVITQKLGKGGAVVFTQLVYLRNMRENDCSEETLNYTTTYLKDAGNSFVEAHNQFVNSYYNINSNNQNEYGLLQLDEGITLKQDKTNLEQTLNNDWNNLIDEDLIPGEAMRNNMNWTLVKVEPTGNDDQLSNEGEYQNLMNKLFEQSWYIDFTTSWTSAILYTLLVIITFIMLIMFIKRLITVSILVVVAPLIGITYSIDKSGDNKSQVVDTWLKEFVYNVFIQIAYAVSYLVFGRIAIDLACTDFSIGATVLAILSMLSMFMGVKIIKQIFGFDKASNLVQQLTMTAVMSKTISTATKGVKGTKGFVEKRANLKQQQRQKAELKNVPQYTPEGKSTEELVKQMKNQKTEEELKARMNEKEKSRKIPRRAHRNKPSIVSVPANMIERGTRNIIGAVGDFAGKINDKISGKQEVVIPAQDIFTSMLHSYVKVSNDRTGATMTREQFEKSTKKIMNEPLKNLNDEEKSLRLIMKDMNKKFGKEQAQSIVAHFKDEKWGNNGTNS